MISAERFETLFNQYAEKQYSAAEQEALFRSIADQEHPELLEELITARWNSGVPEWCREQDDEKAETLFQHILRRVHVKKIFRIPIRRIAVAASILLVIGIGAYLLFFDQRSAKPTITLKTSSGDILAPQAARAMITLADGRIVALDTVAVGTLALQENVSIRKTADGQIIYQGSAGSEIYNTLTNPRGSKVIDMTLSDGSRVWLNAGSSITYPVTFLGNDRKVSMKGEAYFEVIHHRGKPFIVNKGELQVTVLGTHFNVNAYEDEDNIKVTLLEGSIEVNNKNSKALVKPGQQALVAGTIQVQNGIDMEEVMAWKNGRFEFRNTSITSIMKQVSRWYDVAIVYEGPLPSEEFMGATSRQENISGLLAVLEATNKVHFTIEGKKIIVKR